MNHSAKNKEKYVFDPEAHLKKIEAYFNGPPPWRYVNYQIGIEPIYEGSDYWSWKMKRGLVRNDGLHIKAGRSRTGWQFEYFGEVNFRFIAYQTHPNISAIYDISDGSTMPIEALGPSCIVSAHNSHAYKGNLDCLTMLSNSQLDQIANNIAEALFCLYLDPFCPKPYIEHIEYKFALQKALKVEDGYAIEL